MTEKQEQQIQTSIRLPESFFERVDKVAKTLSQPGMPVTRADVLRAAAFKGLEQLEAEKKKR